MSRNLTQAAREFYEAAVKDHVLRRYRAYLENEEVEKDLLQEYQLRWDNWRENEPGLPDDVYAAHLFYVKHFTDEDVGSDRVFKFPIDGKDVYAVRTSTDGDDTWVELYDGKGKFLAAARTHLDVVAWGARAWLRAQAEQMGEYPPELQSRQDETLWGQPLEGFHCRESHDHACTASPPGCCIEPAGHLRADNSPHCCARCGLTWGGTPRLAPQPPPPPPPEPNVIPWLVKLYLREESGGEVYSLKDCPIVLATKDGPETIPVAEVLQIHFAPRDPNTKAIQGRRSDVVLTAGGERTGTLGGEALLTHYPGSTPQKMWFFQLKKLIPLTRKQARDYNTFEDPGTLITSAKDFGNRTRYRIVGSAAGPVFGTDLYALNSNVAAAAVHAGRVRAGKKGIVEVEVMGSPPRFEGSTRNGVTSEAAGEYTGGAFRFLEPEGD